MGQIMNDWFAKNLGLELELLDILGFYFQFLPEVYAEFLSMH